MPMDETAIDLAGRPHAVVDLKLRVQRGDLQSELIHDFFEGFASAARANVHAVVLYGRSSHHHVEAVFKAFARHFVWPARVTVWRKCCRARKACCDCTHRLRRRKSDLGEKGPDGPRVGFTVPAIPRDLDAAAGLIVPGVGHFAATKALDASWRDHTQTPCARVHPVWHLPRNAVVIRRQRGRARAAWSGALAGRCRLLSGNQAERLKIPMWDGTHSRHATVATALWPSFGNLRVFHALVCRAGDRRLCCGNDARSALRRPWNATTCSACSFTPKNQAMPACRSCATSWMLPHVLTKRIIACMDVRDGQVVKGVQFQQLRHAGDPAELARRYNVEGIDEVVVLDVHGNA